MGAEIVSGVHLKNLLLKNCRCVIVVPVDSVDYSRKYLLLSDDEKKRADSFKLDADRASYIVAHSLKRYCLSAVLGIEPKALLFSTHGKGKPFCQQADTIDFNLSHSAGWVLLGISVQASIGVDVEKADRKISNNVIAYAFTDEQASRINTANKNPEFSTKKAITYWTQKEAVSKAVGAGIAVGFKNIDCSGEVDVSKAYCCEQELLVQSYYFNEIVFSVANTSNSAADIYYLSQWWGQSKEGLLMEQLF